MPPDIFTSTIAIYGTPPSIYSTPPSISSVREYTAIGVHFVINNPLISFSVGALRTKKKVDLLYL